MPKLNTTHIKKKQGLKNLKEVYSKHNWLRCCFKTNRFFSLFTFNPTFGHTNQSHNVMNDLIHLKDKISILIKLRLHISTYLNLKLLGKYDIRK